MKHPDQQDIIAFLSAADTYGLRSGRVERIDTHISTVFLAGRRAYKMKRAVRFPYLDYSSLEQRRGACVREVQLNRRTAPSLYRAVIAVTREGDGRLALGGAGEPIEWLVEMVRFDDALLLDRVAAAGRLGIDLTRDLALAVAAFHDGARPRGEYGGSAAMRWVVDGNLSEMESDTSGTMDPRLSDTIHTASIRAIARNDVLLEARRFFGLVRQCHGDLHLHNAFLDRDRPVLFDAIEFNDDLACIDVLYDFAFLLMDLLHRGLPRHASAALNAYMEKRHDYRGLTLLPLFLSARAAVRAKVSLAEAAVQPRSEDCARLRDEARRYQRLAAELLDAPSPALVAVGGYSGSGKSTLAALLAPSVGPAPGAIVIRTDVIRKQLFGVDPHHRLPQYAYDDAVTAQVYTRALHAAEACVRSGHAAIVDAVFADPRHRDAVQRLAAISGVPFTGLWLEAPFDVAAYRLQTRGADVSDATVRVLRAQMRKDPGPIAWSVVDTLRIRMNAALTLADLARPVASGVT